MSVSASSAHSAHIVKEKTASARRVLVMAAGTGGHIFPALAVAQALQQQGCQVSWLATKQGMEHRLVPQHQIALHPIDIQGVRGNGLVRLLLAPFKILKATLAAIRIMRAQQIEVVAGFGGYVAGPGGLAAKLLGIPLVIHEQNAIAGMTNKQLSRFASKVLQAFPSAFAASAKVITTGNPVRSNICNIEAPQARYAARARAIKILIIGGSLGAQALNTNIPQALQLLFKSLSQANSDFALEITHQCGQPHLEATQAQYQALNNANFKVNVVPFIDDMANAYAQADMVICRAGALTVSEIAAVGLPAVFIPLPTAVDDHQTANARYLTDVDAALLCPQSLLTPESLAAKLTPLMQRDVLMQMAIKARSQAKPDATQAVVNHILAL